MGGSGNGREIAGTREIEEHQVISWKGKGHVVEVHRRQGRVWKRQGRVWKELEGEKGLAGSYGTYVAGKAWRKVR